MLAQQLSYLTNPKEGYYLWYILTYCDTTYCDSRKNIAFLDIYKSLLKENANIINNYI